MNILGTHFGSKQLTHFNKKYFIGVNTKLQGNRCSLVVFASSVELKTKTETIKGNIAQPAIKYKPLSDSERTWVSAKLAVGRPWLRIAKNSILKVKIAGDMDVSSTVFGSSPTVPQLCDCLEKAAYDPRISGVFLELSPIQLGWASLTEIAKYIALVRESGKFTVAYFKIATEKDYWLATQCDEIYMPPSGNLLIRGFTVAGTYLKGALEKVGISPQLEKRGKYKSAAELFMSDNMSPENEEQLTKILDSVYTNFLTTVADRRNKTEEEVAKMLDSAICQSEAWLEQGWVDGLLYGDELSELLIKKAQGVADGSEGVRGKVGGDDVEVESVSSSNGSVHEGNGSTSSEGPQDGDESVASSNGDIAESGGDNGSGSVAVRDLTWTKKADVQGKAPPKVPFVQYEKYKAVKRQTFGLNGENVVAVVRITGNIVGDLLPSNSDGNVSLPMVLSTMKKLQYNKKVCAVVLRISSPGGDAQASDIMWKAIQNLSKYKPVVASMGDVAASGGYYLAMGCNAIVAEPLTITGSIGVVAGKFSIEGVLEKLGVKRTPLTRGKYAQLLDPFKNYSDDELAKFNEFVDNSYIEFRNKAADCRGMTPEQMEPLAQGRVYVGTAAAQEGLVDMIGGENEAVRLAMQMAGLPADAGVTKLEFGRKFGSLFNQQPGSSSINRMEGVINYFGDDQGVTRIVVETLAILSLQFGFGALYDKLEPYLPKAPTFPELTLDMPAVQEVGTQVLSTFGTPQYIMDPDILDKLSQLFSLDVFQNNKLF